MSCFDQEVLLEKGRTCACFNLRRASRLVSQHFDQILRPSGLKITQFSLLVAATMNPELRLGKLARIMGMDRTTLSRNLRLLEKKEMVQLGEGQDKREVRVTLTDKGTRALHTAMPLWQQAQEQIEFGVGPDKWQDMLGDLRSLTKALK